jgi:DNA-directed RNA polymerase specialized sigma24 family protein
MLTEKSNFEQAWPEVARRLRRMLERRFVPRAAVDDLIQETAARVVANDVQFEGVEDLLRWCNTVVWRLALNEARRSRHFADESYDRPASLSVADDAISRYTLAEVQRRLADLSSTELQALRVRPEGAAFTRAEATKWYVRRHRARARLVAMLDGLVGAIGWLVLRGRRSGPRAALAVPIAAAVLILLLLPSRQGGSARDAVVQAREPMRASTTAAPTAMEGPPAAGSSGPVAVGVRGPSTQRGPLVVPPFAVQLPLDAAVIRGGPRPPDAELVCWDTVVLGVRCVDESDLPVPLP